MLSLVSNPLAYLQWIPKAWEYIFKWTPGINLECPHELPSFTSQVETHT